MDRKDLRREEKDMKRREIEERATIKTLCQSYSGREWLWEQLSRAHIFHTTFNTDHALMAFMEGERNSGLRLLNQIMENCPDQFIAMMRENNERDRRHRVESGNGGDTDDHTSGGDHSADRAIDIFGRPDN